jgi:hypothetical protein
MAELKRNRAGVHGLARKIALTLGAAFVSVALAACGGGGGDNASVSTGAGAGSPAPPGASAGAGPASTAETAAGASSDSGSGSSSAGTGSGDDSGAGADDSGPPPTVAAAPGATTLSWTPPTANEDGTPLKLTGYRIYWGHADDYFPYSVTVTNPGLTRYVVEQLQPATWYFTTTALSEKGESGFSNVIAMQIR